jgi:hypothetical protein
LVEKMEEEIARVKYGEEQEEREEKGRVKREVKMGLKKEEVVRAEYKEEEEEEEKGRGNRGLKMKEGVVRSKDEKEGGGGGCSRQV